MKLRKCPVCHPELLRSGESVPALESSALCVGQPFATDKMEIVGAETSTTDDLGLLPLRWITRNVRHREWMEDLKSRE